MQWIALALVVAHALVLLGHDAAHSDLAVHLKLWQTIFAYSVIVAAPIAAVTLVFTRHARLGFGLLAVSMLGSLLFGVYHHYILVSLDHVAHLPAGESQGLFRLTAAVMAVVELAAAGFGAWCWRKLSRTL